MSRFLVVIVFQFGKLSSFLLYYLELTSYLSRPLNSLAEDLVKNYHRTNEVIHSVLRAFRRFVVRSAGRLVRSNVVITNAKQATTNLQPHKVGLYAIELFDNTLTVLAPSWINN